MGGGGGGLTSERQRHQLAGDLGIFAKLPFVIIWPAPRAGKMNQILICAILGKIAPSCSLGTTRRVPQEKFP